MIRVVISTAAHATLAALVVILWFGNFIVDQTWRKCFVSAWFRNGSMHIYTKKKNTQGFSALLLFFDFSNSIQHPKFVPTAVVPDDTRCYILAAWEFWILTFKWPPVSLESGILLQVTSHLHITLVSHGLCSTGSVFALSFSWFFIQRIYLRLLLHLTLHAKQRYLFLKIYFIVSSVVASSAEQHILTSCFGL